MMPRISAIPCRLTKSSPLINTRGMKTKLLARILCITLLTAVVGLAGELKAFTNATLVEPFKGDGDSFRVKLGDRETTIRLYFVDCAETSCDNSTDARRVRAQTRYFGLTSGKDTIRFGKAAAAFTQAQLAKPFTLYTAFASAPGRSAGGRQYGFVKTSEGNDLGDLLVSYGYARAYGIRRRTPEGIPHDERASQLTDKECGAMLERQGIWAACDAKRLVALRATAREEEAELQEFYEANREQRPTSVDINTAAHNVLVRLPGVGDATATRIISGRPYQKLDDLTAVPGIGTQTVNQIRPYLSLNP